MRRSPAVTPRLLAFPVLLAGSILAFGAAAQDAPKKDGDPTELEAKAQRQMSELEETMDRLARLLEIDEPENAIRLREAYAKAREALLSENMEQIVEYLKSRKLEQALGKHGNVSDELEGLLGILTGGEIDEDAIKKEIARLEAIAKELGELEKKERELAEGSAEMAEGEPGEAGEPGAGEPGAGEPGAGEPGAGEPGAGKPGAGAKKEQDETQEKTDAVAEDMEKGGENGEETPGTEAAQDASAAMGEASASLGSGQPGEAAGSQKEAADKLAEAQEQVQDQIKQLKNQLQSEALAQLKAQFEEMLAKQKELTTTTVVIDTRLGPPAARKVERKDKVEIGKVAKGEGGLEEQSEEAKDVLVEEGSSVVFPKVLEMLVLYLIEAREKLEAEETGKPTNETQKEVEQILEEMIAAIDKEMEYREQKGSGC